LEITTSAQDLANVALNERSAQIDSRATALSQKEQLFTEQEKALLVRAAEVSAQESINQQARDELSAKISEFEKGFHSREAVLKSREEQVQAEELRLKQALEVPCPA
jgi:hypothetical protein